MSRFGLGLEDQEQELEIDMVIDVEDKRNALAGDGMADTPFSPMVITLKSLSNLFQVNSYQ